MNNAKTIRYREFFRVNPTIASQLPIGFPVQKLSWYGLVVTCETCGNVIPDDYTHGTVSSLIPSVITIEAVSCCKHCLHLLPGIWRFRSDGSVEFTNKAGKWVRTYGQRITWWSTLIDRLKQLKPLWENLI